MHVTPRLRTYVGPFPSPLSVFSTHRLRKIAQLEGRFVFLLTASRLAHPDAVLGQMESKWGYHRTEITKYSGACVHWLIKECVEGRGDR